MGPLAQQDTKSVPALTDTEKKPSREGGPANLMPCPRPFLERGVDLYAIAPPGQGYLVFDERRVITSGFVQQIGTKHRDV